MGKRDNCIINWGGSKVERVGLSLVLLKDKGLSELLKWSLHPLPILGAELTSAPPRTV